MADGVLLFHLVSALSKASVGRIKEGASLTRFDKLGNLTVVFRHLRELGVKLSNIGPEDVVAGNLKLIQGLVWTLINFFLVEMDDEDDFARAGGVASSTADHKLTPKQRLLEWVKLLVNPYPGVEVSGWKVRRREWVFLDLRTHALS